MLAQLLDVGDVVARVVSTVVRGLVGRVRAARVEHDQGAARTETAEVRQVPGREAGAARMADEERSGAFTTVRQPASVSGSERFAHFTRSPSSTRSRPV